MDLGLKGRVALVTGASRGIGLAIAERLAMEGARVSVVARSHADVEAIAIRLHGYGVSADLLTREGRLLAFEATLERAGRIDILVNSFGARAGTTWQDTGVNEVEAAMNGNLGVAEELTSMALPHMVSRGWGRVVIVASVYGLEAGGAPAYNMAKAAEIGYIGALGSSLAGTGVTANAVAPGPILYKGGSWDRRLQRDPEAIADFIKRELPAGRLGTPEEVAAVVCFVCSDQASGLNGVCVPADGAQSRSHFTTSG
jgi:3-oxoacyl-[acyl-carrier protein] reductase